MPACGGKVPYPRRMGGGKPRLVHILESLNAGRGTAYDVSETSEVYAENMAIARAIAEMWSANQRLANQANPARMTVTLPRWERILGIVPGATDTMAARRTRVQKRFALIGVLANRPKLLELLGAELGSVLVDVEYISPSIASITVPDATYPWGAVVPDAPWSSTVLHILIRVQVPTGYSEADFQAAVAKISTVLDPIVSSWCTWAWYRPGPVYAAVSGGPSAAGFYLDDTYNLDNEIFGARLTPDLTDQSGWFRGSYAAAPWAGTASTGSSGARSLTAGVAPSVGTAVNGIAPASFNGTTQYLTSATAASGYFTTGSGGIGILFKVDAASLAGYPEASTAVDAAPALFALNGSGYIVLSLGPQSLRASVYDSAQREARVPMPSGWDANWHFAQMRWDGTSVEARVDDGDWYGVRSTGPALLVSNVLVGANYAITEFFDGDIEEVILKNVDPDYPRFDDDLVYLRTRYGLTLT